MKRTLCVVLFMLFLGTSFAQNDSILEFLPQKYQSGVVVYYYYETDCYFVFKAKDYLKSLRKVMTGFEKCDLQVETCKVIYDALTTASEKKMTVMGKSDLYCISVEYILSKVFMRKNVIVLRKVNENDYKRIYYRTTKKRCLLTVTDKEDSSVVFTGVTGLKKIKN